MQMQKIEIDKMVEQVVENSLGNSTRRATKIIEDMQERVKILDHNIECLKRDRRDLCIR
jgi:hypothetical protein